MGFSVGSSSASPSPSTIWIRQDVARTLISQTTSQMLFTNGTLAIDTGVYTLEGLLAVSAMSATSGNAQFQLLGAGTAVLTDIIMGIHGIDGTGGTATQTGSWGLTANGAVNMVSVSTATSIFAKVMATFDVTTAGTLIPSIALLTAAAAASVNVGSYLALTKLGESNTSFNGAWS